REEAQLSVAGCVTLIDRHAEAVLVVDVGGGSTELSWVDLTRRNGDAGPMRATERLPTGAWLSIPVGVVTLAERYPETHPAGESWFRDMVEHVKAYIAAFPHAERFRETFEADRA